MDERNLEGKERLALRYVGFWCAWASLTFHRKWPVPVIKTEVSVLCHLTLHNCFGTQHTHRPRSLLKRERERGRPKLSLINMCGWCEKRLAAWREIMWLHFEILEIEISCKITDPMSWRERERERKLSFLIFISVISPLTHIFEIKCQFTERQLNDITLNVCTHELCVTSLIRTHYTRWARGRGEERVYNEWARGKVSHFNKVWK